MHPRFDRWSHSSFIRISGRMVDDDQVWDVSLCFSSSQHAPTVENQSQGWEREGFAQSITPWQTVCLFRYCYTHAHRAVLLFLVHVRVCCMKKKKGLGILLFIAFGFYAVSDSLVYLWLFWCRSPWNMHGFNCFLIPPLFFCSYVFLGSCM